jgi:hypothetical protein
MLFSKIISDYSENPKENTNTLRGQNSEFLYVNTGGTYNNHCALNG